MNVQCVSTTISQANALADRTKVPAGVCWNQKEGQWQVFDLRAGAGEGEPEFICFGEGTLPFPLNEQAAETFDCLAGQGTSLNFLSTIRAKAAESG